MKKLKVMSIAIMVILVTSLTFNACNNDVEPGQDPNEICNVELCETNGTLKQVCIDEYNDCVAKGGDPEQCAAAATETCTI